MLNFHGFLQCVDNGGTNDAATVTDLRRRIDERAMGREEERYFNEDKYISPSYLLYEVLIFYEINSLSKLWVI